MGKLNEIQEQTTQSYGDNSFTTTIKENTVEFDSAKDSFTFNDPVEVPELRINGTEIATIDAEDKAKLDSLTSPMQVKGRVDGISDLPDDASVGDVYLVGLSGDGNFEEYVCTEVSGSPATPVWENLGHVKVQSDWNQSNISADNYIKNKPAIKSGQGENSIVEGDIDNNVTGIFSHAEGYHTEASGNYGSHAEGNETTASGFNSHAEGTLVTASGASSHAEGGATTASGNNSHAEGYHTTANHKSQHVFGEYNIADPSLNRPYDRGNYVEIVGNGTDENTRSNVRTLDWDGNETLAGNLTVGGAITANGQQILPQKQADWNQTISTESDYIKNKPTKLSDFINDGGGQTTVYKSITIENPTASENMCIFYAPVAMTITEIRGVITGATSVSFKVVSGTSRNAVTTEHNSSAVVCSSVTTGDVATITTAAVAAGSWVAVKTSAIAGAPSELVITLSLNY